MILIQIVAQLRRRCHVLVLQNRRHKARATPLAAVPRSPPGFAANSVYWDAPARAQLPKSPTLDASGARPPQTGSRKHKAQPGC